MAIIEAQLPIYVSRGAVSADDWNTVKHVLPSGIQTRISRQSLTLGRWNIDFETVDETEHKALRNFKLAVKGSGLGFLFYDWADHESDGQQNCSPAVGTGALAAFQLQKTYTAPTGGTSYVRTIYKPINPATWTYTGHTFPAIKIYVGGVLKTETTHYTINYSTGVVTFTGGNIPGNGVTVKWEGHFNKIGHFVNDDNPATIEIKASEDGEDTSIFHHTGIEVEELLEIT